MYKTILVPLDATATDRTIIDHIKQLAKLMNSQVVLLHVATGVPAQWLGSDAGGQEVKEDTSYLGTIRAEFEAAAIPTSTHLAYGDPAKEIIKWVHDKGCDLVAMSTHGHQFVADLVLGHTATRVQHKISVPVLLMRAK